MHHVSSKPAVLHHELHIHYTLSGIGDISLVFIHDYFFDETIWEAQVDYFSSSYQVITMDLAGHGKSGTNRTTWTIEQYGQDIIALLKVLQLKNVILIGHAMGANAALEAAVLYPTPILGIISIEAFKEAGKAPSEAIEKKLQNMLLQLKTNFSDAAEKYLRKDLLNPDSKSSFEDRMVSLCREANVSTCVGTTEDRLNYHERERYLLQHLLFKLFLINSTHSPTNTDALNEYAVNSYELYSMNANCHFPMIENAKEMNELLGKAIRQITQHKHIDEIKQFIE